MEREGLTRCLNITRVHGKHETGRPIQEALLDRVLDGGNHLSCDLSHSSSRRLNLLVWNRYIKVLDKDGDTLHGFIAQWTKLCTEGECMVDQAFKVCRRESFGVTPFLFLCRFVVFNQSVSEPLANRYYASQDRGYKQLLKLSIVTAVNQNVWTNSLWTECNNLINDTSPEIPFLASIR